MTTVWSSWLDAGRWRGSVRTGSCSQRCSRAIEEVTGYSPELMRPSGGRLLASQNSALRELGLSICWWTTNTADYKYQDADMIARTILRGAKPGTVILLHDGIPATLQALRRMVPILRERGYSFVDVQELGGQNTVNVVQSPSTTISIMRTWRVRAVDAGPDSDE